MVSRPVELTAGSSVDCGLLALNQFDWIICFWHCERKGDVIDCFSFADRKAEPPATVAAQTGTINTINHSFTRLLPYQERPLALLLPFSANSKVINLRSSANNLALALLRGPWVLEVEMSDKEGEFVPFLPYQRLTDEPYGSHPSLTLPTILNNSLTGSASAFSVLCIVSWHVFLDRGQMTRRFTPATPWFERDKKRCTCTLQSWAGRSYEATSLILDERASVPLQIFRRLGDEIRISLL